MCKGLYRGLGAKNDVIKLLSGIALVGGADFVWVTKRGSGSLPQTERVPRSLRMSSSITVLETGVVCKKIFQKRGMEGRTRSRILYGSSCIS